MVQCQIHLNKNILFTHFFFPAHFSILRKWLSIIKRLLWFVYFFELFIYQSFLIKKYVLLENEQKCFTICGIEFFFLVLFFYNLLKYLYSFCSMRIRGCLANKNEQSIIGYNELALFSSGSRFTILFTDYCTELTGYVTLKHILYTPTKPFSGFSKF